MQALDLESIRIRDAMASPRDIDRELGDAYVSTGDLPPTETVQALVTEAYERFRSNAGGENSRVYPALAAVPPDLFGICVVGTSGNSYVAGDAEHRFPVMSVS